MSAVDGPGNLRAHLDALRSMADTLSVDLEALGKLHRYQVLANRADQMRQRIEIVSLLVDDLSRHLARARRGEVARELREEIKESAIKDRT